MHYKKEVIQESGGTVHRGCRGDHEADRKHHRCCQRGTVRTGTDHGTADGSVPDLILQDSEKPEYFRKGVSGFCCFTVLLKYTQINRVNIFFYFLFFQESDHINRQIRDFSQGTNILITKYQCLRNCISFVFQYIVQSIMPCICFSWLYFQNAIAGIIPNYKEKEPRAAAN